MRYYDIRCKCIKSCRDYQSNYIICAILYKIEDYCCSIVEYNKQKEKVALYYRKIYKDEKAHTANSPSCKSKYMTDI